MVKKKNKYDVTTVADCLTDNAVDEKGAVAFNTFMNEDFEYSNDYIIPFHAICEAKVKLSQAEIDVDDPTCQSGDEPTPPTPGEPRIDGADNTSVAQGKGFDLTAGVKAYDGDGNEIPFTVTPSEIDKCDIGNQSFTYSAEGVTKVRTIEVTAISDPTINGLAPLEVEVGEEFDPLAGVSAVDGNGNEVEVTYDEPIQYVKIVDVANYTAPNSTPTAQTQPWVYERLEYEVGDVLADGVPVTVNSLDTYNDTTIRLRFSDFDVELLGRDDYRTFTSTVTGINPPNEVTFERLIIKYPEE